MRTLFLSALAAVSLLAPRGVEAQSYMHCYALVGGEAIVSQAFLANGSTLRGDARRAFGKQVEQQFWAAVMAAGRNAGRTSLSGDCPSASSQAGAESARKETIAYFQEQGDRISRFTFDYTPGGPSLEETLAWLESKVEENGGIRKNNLSMSYRWEGEGCSVHLTATASGGRVEENRFDLSSISHAEVVPGGNPYADGLIFLVARSGRPIEHTYNGTAQRERVVRISFFDDVALAGRAAAAFSHAAQLCSRNRPREVF